MKQSPTPQKLKLEKHDLKTGEENDEPIGQAQPLPIIQSPAPEFISLEMPDGFRGQLGSCVTNAITLANHLYGLYLDSLKQNNKPSKNSPGYTR